MAGQFRFGKEIAGTHAGFENPAFEKPVNPIDLAFLFREHFWGTHNLSILPAGRGPTVRNLIVYDFRQYC